VEEKGGPFEGPPIFLAGERGFSALRMPPEEPVICRSDIRCREVRLPKRSGACIERGRGDAPEEKGRPHNVRQGGKG